MIYEFKLPDIGEGLTEGELVKWHVKPGDTVTENQPLCNVLTDKAEVEIPSPKTGKIVKLFAEPGQKVAVHSTLVSFELSDGGGAPSSVAGKPDGAMQAQRTQAAPVPKPGVAASSVALAQGGPSVSATPAVRKLAKDLSIDLSTLKGTGPGGRITEDDVRGTTHGNGSAATPAPQADSQDEDRVPYIGIRRKTGEKMALSAHTIPHVAHMDEVDFTALVALREELKPQSAQKGIKLTYLPFLIKALVKTLKEFPDFNAVLDEKAGFVLRKRAYNIGLAASTPQGLVVPVVKQADAKDIWALAAEVNRLAEKARAGKLDVAELQDGTFTITNIGPIGGLWATPIINYPEVAILAFMKIAPRPVARDGQVVIRQMSNLVLSFDHRVADGAQAAQFMNTLIKYLENPRTLLP